MTATEIIAANLFIAVHHAIVREFEARSPRDWGAIDSLSLVLRSFEAEFPFLANSDNYMTADDVRRVDPTF